MLVYNLYSVKVLPKETVSFLRGPKDKEYVVFAMKFIGHQKTQKLTAIPTGMMLLLLSAKQNC